MQAFASSLLRAPVARLALVCAGALAVLPALELGYRLHTHRPVLVLDDWRATRIEDTAFGERGRYDGELGWAPRDGYESERYNTLDYGLRRNFCESAVRTGAILAVGDVFTNGGIEVADGETWPAHLERLADAPVLNGGVAGYAADQIVLRAERLLPLVRPSTLVVSLFEEAIGRTRLSSFGAAKPYFTIEGGGLVYHPPARRDAQPPSGWRADARDVLARSAVLDTVLSELAPAFWLGGATEHVIQEVDNDPVAVTCALLQRLKARADTDGTRLVLLMQHARKTIAQQEEPGTDASKVMACAASMGMEVVDQLPALRAKVAAAPGILDELYLQSDGYGQMTAKGNRSTAELVAAALDKTAALAK
jgi:hypothetical protein